MIALLAMVAAASAQCPAVELTIAPKSVPAAFSAKLVRQASANFDKAYRKACAEHLLKKPLARRIVLHNAPDANVASIYSTGGRTLLEYWFVTHDGKTHVPAVGELHEAIYCAAHGASAKEQQESGRCLPD